MRHILFAVAILAASGVTAHAETPPYLLLRTPTEPTPHHSTHNHYPGYGVGVATQAYSYGWFGAPPRRHWSRHFGYYRNYTQWSGK